MTRVPFADLRAEYQEIKSEVDQAVHRVLDSGWFILGPELESFEREFADFCGVPHAVGVGSGTDALYLALKALDIGPGDEVITVAHTFIATALAITFTGATPVFVDIDARTFTIDPEGVNAALTSRSKAILPVHLYGQMADMAPLMAIAARHGLAVVEDACQAHGASYEGRKAGAFGHLGCFSFYPTKNLGGYGDGGAVVTSDPRLATRLAALRNYGQELKYHHHSLGTNSRLDEIQAALLRVKLSHLESNNLRRRELVKGYGPLQHLNLCPPHEAQNRTHIYHLYVVRSSARDRLQDHLRQKGIDTLIHYPLPVHLQRAYADQAKVVHNLEATEQAALEILSLPLYPQQHVSQIEAVVAGIESFPSGKPNGDKG